MKERIILASASPRRKEILSNMGYEPVVIKSGADEEINETRPERIVEELSKRKCMDVAAKAARGIIGKEKEFFVLGADTVVSLDGEILGKPADEAAAVKMLRSLSGRVHQVYTGVTLALVGGSDGETRTETFSEKTDVYVSKLTNEEIEDYIGTGEPFDKAGGYGIQGAFGKHVYRIEGDYFNVVGLPAAAVYERLKRRKA